MPPVVSRAPRVVDLVLVVDPHRVFAETLTRRLRLVSAIGDAQAAFTAHQAKAAAGRREPDVVLVDQGLARGSGLDLIRHLEALPSRPQVVVLGDGTRKSGRGMVPAGCRWVSKESPLGDLLQVIGAGRDLGAAPVRAPQAVVLTLPSGRRGGPAHVAVADGLGRRLTERQADVLHCLLAGLTRAEVATALRLSPHTVRDHVRHLFRVTGATSTADLLARAQAAGVTEARRLRVVPGP
jgi:DNA-binding NarL/FixJ family response regulator